MTKKDNTETKENGAIELSTAVSQLKQIKDNFENWAKKERARFVDPNGKCPPKITLTKIEDWVNTWIDKQRLIAVFFSNPNLSYDKNDFALFLTSEPKEFQIIIDVFRFYKPDLAISLKELYDEFWENIDYHIKCHERSKEYQLKVRKGEIHPRKFQIQRPSEMTRSALDTAWIPVNFLDGAVANLIRRLRNIIELVNTKPKDEKKKIKEPSKKAIQAYHLRVSTGWSQEYCAEIMTKILNHKKPYGQYQISRWEKKAREWLNANNLDVFPKHMTTNIITMDNNKLEIGTRMDSKITGDPVHAKKKIEDSDSGFDD